MRIILAVMLCVVFTSVVEAQAQQSLNLMPLPAKVQTGNGRLLIDRNFSVSIAGHHEARLDRAVEIFLGHLRHLPIAGFVLSTIYLYNFGGQ